MKVESTEKLTITEGPVSVTSDDKKHHKKKRDNCSWLVWILVIFIFVIFVVLAVMWWAQPDCVTRDCDDGGKEVNPYYACGYAFGIAILVIVILAVIWGCCSW